MQATVRLVFHDGVRFSLIDGREVSEGEYAVALLTHLGAPVIGAVALVITTVAAIRLARTGGAPDGTDTSAPVEISMP